MGHRNAGYDQSRDPRTGRPPLAVDAERIKAERIKQQEGKGYAPEGQQEAPDDRNAEASEDAITVEQTDGSTEFHHEQRSTDGNQGDDDEVAVEQAVDDLESPDDGSADDQDNR